MMLPLLLGAPQTFDRGKEPFQSFLELVRLRNRRLVHFKPHNEVHETDRVPHHSQYFGEVVKDSALAAKYMACIGDMILELSRLTGGTTDVPDFLKGARYLSTVSTEVAIPIGWQGSI